MNKTWAILIGINQYQHLQPPFYAQQDAQALWTFLVQEAGVAETDCVLLSDRSLPIADQPTVPTRMAILGWLQHLCTTLVQPDDKLWVVFIGYGVVWEQQDYLLPMDADPRQVPTTAIAMETLYQTLQQAPTDNILVLLDMNRSRGRLSEDPIGTHTLSLAETYEISTILSCRPEQNVSEVTALSSGLFMSALLEGLRYQGCVTPAQIATYLGDRLPELSQHHWLPEQNPVAAIPVARRHELIVPHQLIANQPVAYTALSEVTAADLEGNSSPSLALMPVPQEPTVLPEASVPASSWDWETWLRWGAIAGLLLLGVMLVRTFLGGNPPPAPTTATPSPTPAPSPPTPTTTPTVTASPEPEGLMNLGAAEPTPTVGTSPDATGTDAATSALPPVPPPTPPVTPAPSGLGVLNPFRARSTNDPATPGGVDETGGFSRLPDATQPPVAPEIAQRNAQQALEQGDLEAAAAWLAQVPMTAQDDQHRAIAAAVEAQRGPALAANQAALDAALAPIRPNQASSFSQAITIARRIQPGQPLYAEAQANIDRWSRVILDLAQGRAAQGNLDSAIAAANLVPRDRPALYQQAQADIALWQQRQVSRSLLQEATTMIRANQAHSYQRGILWLQRIPPGQPESTQAQQLIDQWSKEILTIAQTRASRGQFQSAIQAAALVPENTTAYASAQQAIQRWRSGG